MHPVLVKIQDSITRYRMLTSGAGVIVGISGGADSVTLLKALADLGYRCHAVHCNFHLRGEESDRDEEFTRSVCGKLNVALEVIHFNVEKFIAESRRPVSIEMACRDLRYNKFEELRVRHGAEAIAVAHSADDNIETVLMNMFRGSGIAGMRGMLPVNDRHVIRPMLQCSRKEIEDYLASESFNFITDSSNLSSKFTRNRLRNLVLPVIDSNFPEARKGITETLSLMRGYEAFTLNIINRYRRNYVAADGTIALSALLKDEPGHAPLILHHLLAPYGVSPEQINDITAAPEKSGRRFPVNDGILFIDRGFLKFEMPVHAENPTVSELFTITHHDIKDFKPEREPFTAYFDSRILRSGELSVKFWQDGDTLKPFGMKGTKKLSDIFSDAKIPLYTKAKIPLLTLGNEIIWVTGLRQSRLFMIKDDTESFISVRYTGPDIF